VVRIGRLNAYTCYLPPIGSAQIFLSDGSRSSFGPQINWKLLSGGTGELPHSEIDCPGRQGKPKGGQPPTKRRRGRKYPAIVTPCRFPTTCCGSRRVGFLKPKTSSWMICVYRNSFSSTAPISPVYRPCCAAKIQHFGRIPIRSAPAPDRNELAKAQLVCALGGSPPFGADSRRVLAELW
jgi:hypothetical protein